MTGPVYINSKIADHQRTSCNNRIAWSLKGLIAYVSNDFNVNITHLTCLDGEHWDFSGPFKIKPQTVIKSAAPISYLSWSPLGTDLACADEHGNVSIYSTNSPSELGSMQCLFQSNQSATLEPYETNKIIGFKWFDVDNPINMANPPVISQQKFQQAVARQSLSYTPDTSPVAIYTTTATSQNGPHIPIITGKMKQSCIALTQRGNIKLFCQGVSDFRYFEIPTQLDSDEKTHESTIFSHASFAGTANNTLLLAAYSSRTETIYLYELNVSWPALEAFINPAKKLAGESNSLGSVKVKRLTRQKLTPQINPSFYLSHIHLLPAGPKGVNAHFDAEAFFIFSSKTQSMHRRYLIGRRKSTLHPNLFTLNSRNDAQSQRPSDRYTTSLVPTQDAATYNKLVVSLGSLNFDSQIYICFADGSVEVKFRHQYVSGKISGSPLLQGIFQAGFVFPTVEFASDVCLSHNLCSALYLDKEGQLCINYIRNNKISMGMAGPKGSREIRKPNVVYLLLSAITLAARYSLTLNTLYYCGDDLFAVMKLAIRDVEKTSPVMGPVLLRWIMRESYHAARITFERPPSSENNNSISNQNLGRVLILQTCLGTEYGWKRTAMGRIAWASISLRTLGFGFSFTSKEIENTHKNKNANNDPVNELNIVSEYFMSILGMARTLVDMIAFICQDLYMASIEENYTEYYMGKQSVAMSLLLSRIPRKLLMMTVSALKSLENKANNYSDIAKQYEHKKFINTYRLIRDVIQIFVPVPFEAFERILTHVERAMEVMHNENKHFSFVEEELTITGVISPALKPVVQSTIELFMSKILDRINVPWLYYYDVSWLGLNDDYQDSTKSSAGHSSEPGAERNGNTEANGNSPANPSITSPLATTSGSPNPISSPLNTNHAQLANINNNNNNNNNSNNEQTHNTTSDAKTHNNSTTKKKKYVSLHPHPAALRAGKEIDYLLKEQIPLVLTDGTRCRCVRCGEVSVWHPFKRLKTPLWVIMFHNTCICEGAWIPADY